jgi:hypothetical protein
MPGGVAQGEMTARRPACPPFLKNRLRHFRALLSSLFHTQGNPVSIKKVRRFKSVSGGPRLLSSAFAGDSLQKWAQIPRSPDDSARQRERVRRLFCEIEWKTVRGGSECALQILPEEKFLSRGSGPGRRLVAD